MNRTGVTPSDTLALYEQAHTLPGINIVGLHAYDGHIRDVEFDTRKKRCDEAFKQVTDLQQRLRQKFNAELTLVVGGTPTFSVHCLRSNVECSPGTFIYWDIGYAQILKEQQFTFAALVVSQGDFETGSGYHMHRPRTQVHRIRKPSYATRIFPEWA